ncbi:MAG: DUF1028 domain-containing protein [Acidobacteria bacterium]|nr:DUF1028 domain-containing protein [Acidobacteriota bacterium]
MELTVGPSVLLAAAAAAAAAAPAAPLPPARPVHTYSIVARDAATGELGVAVQSHWFAVGAIVSWAEPGVGAVATQSMVEASYGPEGLRLMREGKSAREALDLLLAKDPQRDSRQVAMVDAKGRVASWTGKLCIPEAGHASGDGFSVQANLMEKASVWPAMAKAFEATRGKPLAERLLAALDAAQAEGGDLRGKQSAALLVVKGARSKAPWNDRVVDLRVDDDPEPLKELRRLYDLDLAYDAMNEGDALLAAGKTDAALAKYSEGMKRAPQVVEMPFWVAVTLFSTGQEEKALPLFAEVFRKEPLWRTLVPRLPKVGLLPDDPQKIEAILKM